MVDNIVDIPEKENQILYHSPYGEYHIIFNQRNGNQMETIDIYCEKNVKKLFTFSITDFIEVIWGNKRVAIVCYFGTWICCLNTGHFLRLPISGSTIGFVAAFSPNSELFAFLNRLHTLELLNLNTNEIVFSHQIYNRIQKFEWINPLILHFEYKDENENEDKDKDKNEDENEDENENQINISEDINLLQFFGKTFLTMLIVQKRRLSVRLPHELWSMMIYDFFT